MGHFKDIQFTEAEVKQASVTSMPDEPSRDGMGPEEIKAAFAQMADVKLALGRMNDLLENLDISTAAQNIGAQTPTGGETTIQQELQRLENSITVGGYGDMRRSTYDANNNGIVDDAEKVGGRTLAQIKSDQWPVGSIYMSVDATNPSSIFGGTWSLFGPGRTVVCVNTADATFNTPNKVGGSKDLQSHAHSGNTASANNLHNHTGSVGSTSISHSHGVTVPITYGVTEDANTAHYHRHAVVQRVFGGSGAGNYMAEEWNGPNMQGSYTTSGQISASGQLRGDLHNHGFYVPARSVTSAASNPAHGHNVTINQNTNGGHIHSFSTSNTGAGSSGNLMPFITCYMWRRTA